MTKTGLLFAGQGAQKLGMARDLYDNFESVKATYDEASEMLGYDLRQLIDADADKLGETKYTQPAILTTSVAILRLLEAHHIAYDVVAGLSLGEYSALVASGSLPFADAVRLIAKRGQYMADAAPTGSGKMVAVMNTAADVIETACQQASAKGIVSPANYNTPGQIVIGGEVAAVDAAVDLLTAAGVKRMIPLKVSGPFHTALLEPASEKLAVALETVAFKPFAKPLISNTTAEVMAFEDIKALLTRQVMEPVKFYDSVETMLNMGVTDFIEIGPGKTLSGFVKKIDKTVSTTHVEDLATLQAILEK
ncbi:ACP S-malonyltransferase [Pseudolactococcus reticulitermitis]|uniref:Malonyl CoA-acyl carrier protein transacylase n=1 Tax=Pseudolactococcus reticulitermitis TaxID=2025039 RepID=A0A224WWM5_9LACT|nr:ACP S-malonyltransferase [Lactococcus reticulitermitis]GAX46718.1 malonyl CoA-acyl carrier protein transacylase [Lactococcus reticulitermitis]